LAIVTLTAFHGAPAIIALIPRLSLGRHAAEANVMYKNMNIQISENIILRSLEDGDIPSITKSANNKKSSDNLREILQHPYTEQDAESFVSFA